MLHDLDVFVHQGIPFTLSPTGNKVTAEAVAIATWHWWY